MKPTVIRKTGWAVLHLAALLLPAVSCIKQEIIRPDDPEKTIIPVTKEPADSRASKKTVNLLVQEPDEGIIAKVRFTVSDTTTDPQLRGLLRLRKLTARNIASKGDYDTETKTWKNQRQYGGFRIFEGNQKVPVDSSLHLFAAGDSLAARENQAAVLSCIPDTLERNKQVVEVVFEVEGFTLNGFHYETQKDVKKWISLTDLTDEPQLKTGESYVFDIGINLNEIFKEITFSPSTEDWNTVYSN